MKTTAVLRKDGHPFASKNNATTRMRSLGIEDSHTVEEYGYGYAILPKALNEEQVTLQKGDYIATAGLSEDDYHNVARAFMAAGADAHEYDANDCPPNSWDFFGWEEDQGLAHWDSPNSFEGSPRQLTLSQILSATNAGSPSTEPAIETKPMHLTDQLEAAIRAQSEANAEVERLQAEWRTAYPGISGCVDIDVEDIKPEDWQAGDIVECIKDDWFDCEEFIVGVSYTVSENIGDSGIDGVFIKAKDSSGCTMNAPADHFKFIRRP